MRLFILLTLLALFFVCINCRKAKEPPSVPIPLTEASIRATEKIVNYLMGKAHQDACMHKPLFLTIANVGSRLYWKLIENFFYTMEKFGHLDCAVLICVSGNWCMLQHSSFS